MAKKWLNNTIYPCKNSRNIGKGYLFNANMARKLKASKKGCRIMFVHSLGNFILRYEGEYTGDNIIMSIAGHKDDDFQALP